MVRPQRRIRILERSLSGLKEKRRLSYVHLEMESVRKKPRSWGDREGDGFAGAVVTGLVAYFLSIPVLNNAFRAERSVPKAVRNRLQFMAYERYPGQAFIWSSK